MPVNLALGGRMTSPDCCENITIAAMPPVEVSALPDVTIAAMPDVQITKLLNLSEVDTGNSSTVALLANETFTGAWQELTNWTNISVAVSPNVASATNGLVVQWSMDGITVDDTDSFSILAGAKKQFSFGVTHKYYRVVYTNGNTNQTTFRLQSMLHATAPKPSTHRIQDNIVDEDDAELVESVLKLRTAQNVYVSGAATNAGNFKVSIEEVNDPIPALIADGANLDAFGRLRVAETGNRSDTEFIYGKQPLLFDDISTGAGSAVHQVNSRDILLSVGAGGAGDVGGMRQHYWTPYTPGSGQNTDITGTLDQANIGGGVCSVFLRSTVSGVTTLETHAQATWSSSTAGVNWNYSQIFGVDFQSLKVGRIRFYMVRSGIPTFVYEIINDNKRVSGYWQYASLPPYWKIYNDGANTVAEFGYGDEYNGVGFRYVFNGIQTTAKAVAICSTVKSEGGEALFSMPGFPFSASSGITAKLVSNVLIPILSIRVAPLFNGLTNRGISLPTSYSLRSDNDLYYKVVYRPVLTGPAWAAIDAAYCGLDFDVTASAFTGGIVIDEDYIAAGQANRTVLANGLLGKTIMSLGNIGVPDIVSIVGVRLGSNNANVYATIKGREIR